MKLLTLNTHSLIEKDYDSKLRCFVDAVAKELPDIIALQEVNQSLSSHQADADLFGYVPCGKDVVIRDDNHIMQTVKRLRAMGAYYHWTWLPIKKGYNRYLEGIGVMSKSRILQTKTILVSKEDNEEDWKTRKILGIRTEAYPQEWFFSVHYGWWGDESEPFYCQWRRTCESIGEKGQVWLMGDFNNPADVRNEGYDMISSDGWLDSFLLAQSRDSGATVEKAIDGWEGNGDSKKIRIDQIWCRHTAAISSSRVIFNGSNRAVVSDHYGVIVECERGDEA